MNLEIWGVLRFTLKNPHNLPGRKFTFKIQKKHRAIGCDSTWDPRFLFMDGVDDIHRQPLFQIRNDEIQGLFDEWYSRLSIVSWLSPTHISRFLWRIWSSGQSHDFEVTPQDRECVAINRSYDRMIESILKSLRNFNSNPITARSLHPSIPTVCDESVE
jgi:hypothetical protein